MAALRRASRSRSRGAPSPRAAPKPATPVISPLLAAVHAVYRYVLALFTSWDSFGQLALLLLSLEAVLGACIIHFVPCAWRGRGQSGSVAAAANSVSPSPPPPPLDTEIDWIAYMQEVDGWAVEGSTDYLTLKGDTGPLVYPAGFLYAYRGLRAVVGGSVPRAQWAFLVLYLAVQAVVLAVFRAAKLGAPGWAVLLVLSKRVHSLFLLRLFNDCLAVLGSYAAVWAAAAGHWDAAVLLLSAGVSIKMSGLLLLPGLLFLLARNRGAVGVVRGLSLLVASQALVGAPFLLTYPRSYLTKAFELSRVFTYKWSVNWRFLPEPLFVSKEWAGVLLAGHLASLVCWAGLRWCAGDGGLIAVLGRLGLARGRFRAPSFLHGAFHDAPGYIVYVLLVSNLLGIVFARTLHYQFYTWYFHSLPLLVGCSGVHPVVSLAVLAGVEYGFNATDAAGEPTPRGAVVLQVAHVLLLAGLWWGRVPKSGGPARR